MTICGGRLCSASEQNFCGGCTKMRKWQIKRFFFKPVFRHKVFVSTEKRDPDLLQRRKEWCDKHLGTFTWMILVEPGLWPGFEEGDGPSSWEPYDQYTWNQSLFHFRRKKDAAAFKLTWYKTNVM